MDMEPLPVRSGGREHGHKCDQLPGNRDIETRNIASIVFVDVCELRKGIYQKKDSTMEIIEAIRQR
jgi:assimilatory nitrate reductase catalytic subunit